MAKVAITEQYLEDIADAIREKTGLTNLYYPSQMAPAILTISGSGGITPTGTISITSNGTYNVTQYASASVSVPTGATILNQDKTVTPTESVQIVGYDSGYTGLEHVTVRAIDSGYVGSGITRNTSSDLTVSGASVSVPAGYYENDASTAVASGTAGTPSASKGTVSNHSISVTPSVTNTTGYITGGTKTGTAVTVTASELVSGTKSISANGTNIDVTNYAKVDVSVSSNAFVITLEWNDSTERWEPNKTYAEIASAYQNELEIGLVCDTGNLAGCFFDDEENLFAYYVEQTVDETNYNYMTVRYFMLTANGLEEDSDGTQWFDSRDANAVASEVASGAQFFTSTGFAIGTATRRSSTDLSASGATVTAPAGYYASSASKSVASGTAGTPTATKGTVSNHSISITPSVTNTTGYITGSTISGTAVSVSASELVSGNKAISSNGTNIDVTNYATVSVNVSGGGGITPSGNIDITAAGETDVTEYATATVPEGVFVQDAGAVGGIATVAIDSDGLISSTYSSYQTVSPVYKAGWFGTSATVGTTVSVAGSLQLTMISFPTSSGSSATSGYTSKATITPSTSAQYINIPAGYSSGGVYYKINAMASGSATGPSSLSGSSATITTGTNTITLTKTGVSTTPTVSAGYVSSATASTATVTLTASVTVDPTPTASGATVTIPAGYYSTQTTKSVTTMTLPTSASSSATSGYTKKATISRSTSAQYINIAPGYNSAGGYYEISAVANGSASAPTSISGTSATVSTGTNTLTLTKTVSVTPVVSAGYVSSGTATNSSVSLTASVTTKAATTYHPSTTAQSISSGTYLTGAQTIAAVTTSNLSASNIVSGVTIKVGDSSDDDCVASVTGNVVLQNYYTGSSAPSSSTGSNGDLYLQS